MSLLWRSLSLSPLTCYTLSNALIQIVPSYLVIIPNTDGRESTTRKCAMFSVATHYLGVFGTDTKFPPSAFRHVRNKSGRIVGSRLHRRQVGWVSTSAVPSGIDSGGSHSTVPETEWNDTGLCAQLVLRAKNLAYQDFALSFEPVQTHPGAANPVVRHAAVVPKNKLQEYKPQAASRNSRFSDEYSCYLPRSFILELPFSSSITIPNLKYYFSICYISDWLDSGEFDPPPNAHNAPQKTRQENLHHLKICTFSKHYGQHLTRPSQFRIRGDEGVGLKSKKVKRSTMTQVGGVSPARYPLFKFPDA